MINLYAIINDDKPMETFICKSNQKVKMLTLIAAVLRSVKGNASKFIKSLLIDEYKVYYFEQDTFLFMLATTAPDRTIRMQNYLRVVADIFYENYDEKKFHYVLDKIMANYSKKTIISLQDESQGLMKSSFKEDKRRISEILQKNDKQSRLAYFISTVLFVLIVILGIYYINKKWG